jgi:hypothetical protein
MEMSAMFVSWLEQLTQYLESRFPLRLYLPCALFLAVAGFSGGRGLSPAALMGASALALLLLLQFRLLDDLCDITRDRDEHPERVMVRATSLVPFNLLLCACFLANCIIVSLQPGPGHLLGVFLFINAAALVWYYRLRFVVTGRILGYHIVVGKYPVFAYLLSGNGEERWRLLLALALVYLSFTLYELLHDRSLHPVPGAVTALNAEISVLFAVSALMTVAVIGSRPLVVVLQGLLSVVTLAVMLELFRRRHLQRSSQKTGYAVFILCFIVILNFSLGVRI